MDTDQQLRNLRDFLMVYNRMTETCFQRCSSNFNYRNLTMDEERCVDSCAGKLIRTNHRLMSTYVQLMPRMVQRRMEEMESKAAENAKAAEAAASANIEPPAIAQTPVPSSPPPQASTPFASVTIDDVGPQAADSVFKPAEMDFPVELSKSATSTEVNLSAATALTPRPESTNVSVLNQASNGPSYTAGFPEPLMAGDKSVTSAPVFTSSTPTALSGDVPVSTEAVSALSKPIESVSSRDKVPEVPPPSAQ